MFIPNRTEPEVNLIKGVMKMLPVLIFNAAPSSGGNPRIPVMGKCRSRPNDERRHDRVNRLPGRQRQGKTEHGFLELQAFVDLTRCRKCGDKGVYYGSELVGAVITMGDRWSVWKIRDCGQPLDPADLAMYEDQLEHMADFESLHDAKEYIRGSFCEMILEEHEPEKE